MCLGDTAPIPARSVRELLLSITPESHCAGFEATHDAHFSYEVPGLARFRAHHHDRGPD